MRHASLVLALIISACGPLTPPRPDGGTGGGAATGGGAQSGGGGGTTSTGGGTTTGGGSATGGGDGSTGGGSATGGGTATGGGSAAGGGTGTPGFTWISMTMNPVPTSSGFRRVHGIARRASGDTFVGFADGKLYRAAPGSNLLTAVTNFPTPTNATQFVDLAASGEDLFILRVGTVLHCNTACTDFSEFTVVHTIAFGPETWGICARGEKAFFVLQSSSTQLYGLQRVAPLRFELVSADVGTARGEDCFIDEAGDVYVGGDGGGAVLFAAGGSTVHALNLNGHPIARWTSIAMSNQNGLMVGGGSGMRVARFNGQGFLADAPSTSGPLLNTVLALGPGEFMAAGAFNGGSGPSVYRYDGNTFSAWSPAPPAINAHRGLAVNENEVYLGGNNFSDNASVILHGTR